MKTRDVRVHAAIYRNGHDIIRLMMKNPLLKTKRRAQVSRRSPSVLLALDALFSKVDRTAGVSYSRYVTLSPSLKSNEHA